MWPYELALVVGVPSVIVCAVLVLRNAWLCI